MPQVVLTDLVQGNQAVFTSQGYELTRLAIVSGLTSVGHKQLLDAVGAVGINYLDPHPDRASCSLREIRLESLAAGVCKLQYIYRDWVLGSEKIYDQFEVDATCSQVETIKDKDGNYLRLSYEYPSTYLRDPGDPDCKPLGKTVDNTLLLGVQKFSPQKIIRIRRRENGSPEGKADTFLGKINSDTWRGYAPRTVLCTRLSGRLVAGTGTYDVDYEFQIRPETWDETLAYIDKNFGTPPADIDTNPGDGTNPTMRVAAIYSEVAYSGLGF
jgi:hypothetical protein